MNTELKSFRKHQTEADDAIYEELRTANKCIVKMFCGTGKSLLMRKCKSAQNQQLVVYVFPSLSLIDQFCTDYFTNVGFASPFKISSAKDKSNDKDADTKIKESTTDPALIRVELMKPENKIFCVTYQSYKILLDNIEKTKIDVCIYDEAHHAVGETYQKLIFEQEESVVKQIFFTATPKNANGIVMYDRDNLDVGMCGKLVYDYSYLQGLEDKCVNPFEIRVDMYTENTNKSVYESIARAILVSGNNRVLTFHADVNTDRDTSVINFVNETEFVRAFMKVLADEFPEKAGAYTKFKMIALDASIPTDKRRNILDKFDTTLDNEVYIISSCETIGEGIDTKNANMCVFVDPKSSFVKIIQNIGRIVRKEKGIYKPPSTVLIPCWVDKEKYVGCDEDREKCDEVIRSDLNKDGNFNGILNVLSALRQADENLYDICLHYPDTYSPQEIRSNLEKHGYKVLDPVGDGELVETMEYLLEQDIDYDDYEDCETNEEMIMRIAEDNDVCVEVHTNSFENQIEKYNSECESGEVIRLYKEENDDEEGNQLYCPIVKKCGKRKGDGSIKELNRKDRIKIDVHTNPDVKVLWKLVGDFTKEICSCVLECEVVEYDPMEIAIGIVERAKEREKNGGKLLPRALRKEEHRNTPQLKQEHKDAVKLSNWKSVLKNSNYKWICSNEVRDYLDINLTDWRKELDEKSLEIVKNIVERANERFKNGFNLLPIKRHNQKDRPTIELEQEYKDAVKLGLWKGVLRGKNLGRCSKEVCNYLDENLPEWKNKTNFDEKAMQDCKNIVERAKEREKNGGRLLPRLIYKKENRNTPELEEEYKDAVKLSNWKSVLKNQCRRDCCPNEVRYYLDINLTDWRKELDEKSLENAKNIVERANKRVVNGGRLLPRELRKEEHRNTPELEQEYKDAIKLSRWKQSLKGLGHARCPDENRDYLDTKLPGWRDDYDLKQNAIEFAYDIVKRANKRFANGGNLLPSSIYKTENRNTPELEQQHKDALKISNWKQALKGNTRQICYIEVRDYLDENLPSWRNIDKTPIKEPVKPNIKLVIENDSEDEEEYVLPPKPKKSMKLKEIKSKEPKETPEQKHIRTKSELSVLHQRYKTLTSQNLQKKFQETPELWHQYHAISEENEKSFPEEEIPRNRIIQELTEIKGKRTRSVVDMGCGKAQIADHFTNDSRFTFINYDHVSSKENVLVQDISNTGLEDDSVEICILCLAMWGSNCHDYVREAYRILESGGKLYIMEATKRWTSEATESEATESEATESEATTSEATTSEATESEATESEFLTEGGALADKLKVLLENSGFQIAKSSIEKFCLFVCTKM